MHKANTKPAIAVALVVAVGALAGACATQPQFAKDLAPRMTVDEILASVPKPEGTSSGPVNCLWHGAYSDVEVVNRDLLLFHDNRDGVWLNRLPQSCIGLHTGHALAFEMHGNRLCALDTVFGADLVGRPISPASARCSLGKFEPVSPEQADLLKTGLARH